MEFLKYQHVERFGTPEVEGIEHGMCYVFPKLDGTNAQLWTDGESLKAGSRNRELSLDNDNHGFMNWAVKQQNIKELFLKFPNIRLYGEWLVPHTLKTYQENAWRCFYVFDVMKDDIYLSYTDYKTLLDEYEIEYIPALCTFENPTYESLVKILDKNDYLIQDGKGSGEGIVIKNYNYKNKYGRVTWAKIVKNEFKAQHRKVSDVNEIKDKKMVEADIVDKYVTLSLIEKELAKITSEVEWTSKLIPRLLNTVFYCLVKEESWNYVKAFKNPTVNYGTLQHFTIAKIKELKPELF